MNRSGSTGPGEGFSTRRGGELAADDDVEGHAFSTVDDARRVDAMANDKPLDPQGLGQKPKASDDDVEGHRFTPKASPEGFGQKPKASDDDVEGHGAGGRTPK
jgi:hypothetical protein